VSYKAAPPSGFKGSAYFTGTVVFDEEAQDIQGIARLVSCASEPSPTPTPIARIDSDGDGIDNYFEVQWNSDPLDFFSVPFILDFNQDGKLTINDAVLFYRTPPPAGILLDLNGDGLVDNRDAQVFYQNRIGLIPIIPVQNP